VPATAGAGGEAASGAAQGGHPMKPPVPGRPALPPAVVLPALPPVALVPPVAPAPPPPAVGPANIAAAACRYDQRSGHSDEYRPSRIPGASMRRRHHCGHVSRGLARALA
jgi:hypothetical protein